MKLTIQWLRGALIVSALILLLACGNKGDLYLPEPAPPEPAEQSNESKDESSREDGFQS